MPKYDKHIEEDITVVANVQGLQTSPEGPKLTKKLKPYKSQNVKDGSPKVMTFKEWVSHE